MEATPFLLPEMNVASREVACAAGGVGGADLVAVWEEARKALTATVLTEESVQPMLRRWRWVRRLDQGQRERGEQSNLVEYARGPSFVSAPPDVLRDRGYIELGDSLTTFYAPDARVLLEDLFLETHCFRLDVEARRTEGLVGLQFTPLAGRKVPGIRGTLWVRRRGAELAEITYQYVNLPPEFRGNPAFGGRVAFAPVPGVGWIVREWSLQTPVYGVQEDDGRISDRSNLRAVIRETSGFRQAQTIGLVGWTLEGGTGWVVGGDPPLPGASTVGGERLAGPVVGRPQLCRSSADVGGGLGAVVVRVEHADSAAVAPDVPVVVLVGDPEVQSVRLANDRQLSVVRPVVRIDGMSSSDGLVAVCGVPVGARVRVHAGSVAAPPVHAEVAESPVPVRVAYRPVPATRRASAPAGVLQGRVIDSAGTDVQVIVVDAGRLATTDSGGRYRVTGVPEGRFEVIFRRLGYQPTHTFRDFRQDTSRVDMRLQAEAFVLPEVETRVRGPAEVPVKLREWARRREYNVGGKFWDDSLLRTKEYQRLPELLQLVPGAKIIRVRGRRSLVAGRGGGKRTDMDPTIPQACYTEVYLDGARLSSAWLPFNLDDIPVDQIAAMEFYRSAAEIPPELNATGSACGVLAIWTR